MNNFNDKIQNFGQVIKDTANPFMRLVNNVTPDDESLIVPYYLAEQVKEATFQSEYGLDSVFKAIIARLEHKSVYVQNKTLYLIRGLILEGPAGFAQKIGSNLGRITQLANIDARRDTMEAVVKEAAQAVHQWYLGNPQALRNLATAQHLSPEASGASNTGANKFKSDFQMQQEREQKAFRKRQQEERAKATEVIVTDRLMEIFDGALPPAKLVDSAVKSTRKKFSPEEVQSFVEASQEQKVPEVCAALDTVLKDTRQPLAVRFKILSLIDGMLRQELPDAMTYFRSHQNGLLRHTRIDAGDNPAKAQATQQLALELLQIVKKGVGLSSANGSFSSAAVAQPVQPDVDSLFGNLTVKQHPPTQTAHRTGGGSGGAGEFDWTSVWGLNSTDAGAASRPQQQQQQHPTSFAPPVQPSFAPPAGGASNSASAFGAWGPSAPQSFGTPPQQPSVPTPPPPLVASQPPLAQAAPATGGDDILRQQAAQMMQLQAFLQAMGTQTAPAAAPVAAPPPPVWGTPAAQVVVPPPIPPPIIPSAPPPILSAVHSEAHSAPRSESSNSNSRRASTDPHDPVVTSKEPTTVHEVPVPVVPPVAAPIVAPVAAPGAAAQPGLEMLQQLQAQMAATQAMLQQQQQMFLALQQQLLAGQR